MILLLDLFAFVLFDLLTELLKIDFRIIGIMFGIMFGIIFGIIVIDFIINSFRILYIDII